MSLFGKKDKKSDQTFEKFDEKKDYKRRCSLKNNGQEPPKKCPASVCFSVGKH